MSRNPYTARRLADRLAAVEQRAHAHLMRFTTLDGRTVATPVERVLDVLCGDELPPDLAAVDGTPERAELARSLIDVARAHRAAGGGAQ